MEKIKFEMVKNIFYFLFHNNIHLQMKTIHDVNFIDTNPIQSNPHKLLETYY
jgi:hypothetical protein